jgi:hypothetical protein
MPRYARAFRQGDLDGLCGVYAIINALRYLFQLKEDHCRALFAALIKALHRRCRRPHHPILWGMSFSTLKRLIEAAQTCKVLDGAQTFQARPLRLSRDQRNLPQLWSGLSQELTPTCVAIVGLSGVDNHWSVIYKVTPKTLRLLDSSGQTRIYRSRCTVRSSRTRYCLEAGEILLIQR